MTIQRELTEEIVDKRYTIAGLKEQLKRSFGEVTEVQEIPETELIIAEDYRLDISNSKGTGYIWFLKTRTDNMYITELVFEEE